MAIERRIPTNGIIQKIAKFSILPSKCGTPSCAEPLANERAGIPAKIINDIFCFIIVQLPLNGSFKITMILL
jgi:hypothetical protein